MPKTIEAQIERRKDDADGLADLEALRAELRVLNDRIDAARDLRPQPHELHCLDCFHRGRDAAIRAITGS